MADVQQAAAALPGLGKQGNNGNNWMFYAGNSFNPNETVQQQQEGYSQAGTPGVPWNSLSTLQAQFGYDSLNRLNSVTDTGYARGYHYDEFGNLSVQSNTNVPLSSVTPFYNGSANPYNAATNHIVTVDANNGYDGRGNITKLAVNTVTMGYDAESNMTSTVDTGTGQNISWVYDAEGRRAQKLISGGSWTLYIHDAFGQLAASYNNNGVTPDCTTCYLTYDMVGTPRLITDQNENVVARHDFIPFGEEIQNGVALRNGNFGFTSNVTQAFTGQESDGGTVQLDYFNARHLSAVLGGFVQPDPMNAGADITRPQSWNAYAYVLGNPLGLVDPSGMISKDPDGIDDGDCFDASNADPCFPLFGGGWGGGLGGGGGGASSSGGGSTGAPPSPPLPIGSFPGGETLGFPPGLSLAGPWAGIGQQGCEFGSCGNSFADPGMEDHHIFPQAFQDWFEQHGIDIESYTIALAKGAHRLKPGGLHTKSGGNWNAAWKKWIEGHPNATPQQILNQGKKFLVGFGVGAGDVFSDFFIIVNPCVTNPMAPYCNQGAYNGPA